MLWFQPHFGLKGCKAVLAGLAKTLSTSRAVDYKRYKLVLLNMEKSVHKTIAGSGAGHSDTLKLETFGGNPGRTRARRINSLGSSVQPRPTIPSCLFEVYVLL